MDNVRPDFDKEIQDICDYVCNYEIDSELAFKTAHYDLLDSVACGLMALTFPACTKLMGPVVPGAELEQGVHIIGTEYKLEPVQAAFNLGCMIRWLDFNDTWLAAEWGHPSDNIAGILAIADYLQRNHSAKFTLGDIFNYMIKAHEIQGCIALENSFNKVGQDHVVLVKVASTAIIAKMLGCDREQICNAISLAWLDGQSLRTYRHSPNTGSRKSWAAGDAASRAVRLALLAKAGEMGYPSALSAKTWGYYDSSFAGKPFKFQRPYGSYVMENILFKISFPAEFHAQTAVECAFALHDQVKDRLDDIDKIVIRTQEAAVRIIDKKGPLYNPADRDHCLQYMVAIGLIHGKLTAEHYENRFATDTRVDECRDKMVVSEEPQFSSDYHDPKKRSIANAIQVFFKDGSHTDEIVVEYPVGHRRRRDEGMPLLVEKFRRAVSSHYTRKHADTIIDLCLDYDTLASTDINQFMGLLSDA